MTVIELIDIIVKTLNGPVVKDRFSIIFWTIILGTAFLEFSKAKIYPYTWLLKKLGSIMNSGINSEIKELKNQIDEVRNRQNDLENEAKIERVLYARRRILRANDEIRNEIPHSREFFVEIISDIQAYEEYCEQHKDPSDPLYFRNDRCTESIRNIRAKWHELETHGGYLN